MIAARDERILNYLPSHLEKMPAEKRKAFLIMIGDEKTRIQPINMNELYKMINNAKLELFG